MWLQINGRKWPHNFWDAFLDASFPTFGSKLIPKLSDQKALRKLLGAPRAQRRPKGRANGDAKGWPNGDPWGPIVNFIEGPEGPNLKIHDFWCL